MSTLQSEPRALTAAELELLAPSELIKTGEVDHADWNYRPLVRHIQRLRFKLIRSLLRGRCFERLLEIGYGSGVFMPELSLHCHELFGIDVHEKNKEVTQVLSRRGIHANLGIGSAEAMPYKDGFFDAVIAVSALEFIPDLDKACKELQRVLSPMGVFIVVTPGQSWVLDVGLRLLTGASAKNDFEDRRKRIVPCLTEHFGVQRALHSPRFIHPVIKLYTAFELQPNRKGDGKLRINSVAA